MNFFTKNAATTLKVIGWIQIIGGITGLGVMAYLLMRTDAINGPVLLIFLTGLSLFIFSIHCGITLLSQPATKKAIILSLINQALQFIQWCMLGFGLSYSSGAQVLLGLKGSSIGCNFDITSNFSMQINSSDTFLFKINLLAVFIFIVLIRIYRTMNAGQGTDDIAIATEPNSFGQ